MNMMKLAGRTFSLMLRLGIKIMSSARTRITSKGATQN